MPAFTTNRLISDLPRTFAAWPVWHDSARAEVRFVPASRKAIARIWHKARRWDRETRQPGRHGGIVGRTALATLYALAFDFLNYRTGRLDPSLDQIAAKAGCCRRAVVNALARLRELGLLAWQRRCEEDRDTQGRFRLRQRTNAYGLLPPRQWKGYLDDDPPVPDAATLGAPEPVLAGADAAVAERAAGGTVEAALRHLLESDDPAQTAMGRFLTDLMSREKNSGH